MEKGIIEWHLIEENDFPKYDPNGSNDKYLVMFSNGEVDRAFCEDFPRSGNPLSFDCGFSAYQIKCGLSVIAWAKYPEGPSSALIKLYEAERDRHKKKVDEVNKIINQVKKKATITEKELLEIEGWQ